LIPQTLFDHLFPPLRKRILDTRNPRKPRDDPTAHLGRHAPARAGKQPAKTLIRFTLTLAYFTRSPKKSGFDSRTHETNRNLQTNSEHTRILSNESTFFFCGRLGQASRCLARIGLRGGQKCRVNNVNARMRCCFIGETEIKVFWKGGGEYECWVHRSLGKILTHGEEFPRGESVRRRRLYQEQ
jgi:hypothetical protein